jgi:arylsulfatase A-like enzyme
VTSRNNAFHAGKTALVDKQLPGAQTLPELFRRSGYSTALIGKISHMPDGRVFGYDGTGDGRPELPQAWDELLTPFAKWKRGWGAFFAYADGRHREDGNGNSDLWEFQVENDDDLPDGLNAAAAIKKLREFRAADKPFFLGLGFYKPHLPFVATKQDWEAFAETDFERPSSKRIDSPYWHESGEFYKYRSEHEKSRPLGDDAIVKSKRAYVACVRYVDRQIGRVLDELDATGLSDRTLVVIWGDHGWHLGEQQLWGKHTPFERATRSVLLMRVPGMTAGRKSDSLVATIDLYPTLIEVCNPKFRSPQRQLDGKSFVPILRHERTRTRNSVRSYWRDAISVRTETHRLVARMDGAKPKHVELYDVSSNPDSNENLAQLEAALRIRLEEKLLSP